MEYGASRSIVDRMRGAAMLDVATYEDVEHDVTATGQAATVVAVVALCTAVGNIRYGGLAIVSGLIFSLVGWLLWAGITYLIGTKLLGGTATWGELLRTLGFAQAPGVFMILGIIPILGGMVRFAVFIWLLAAGIVAIRQALDFSTGKAVLTAILGWIAMMIVTAIFGGSAFLSGGLR